MKRLLLPWSKVHVPGISAEEITGQLQTSDPIVEVPHSAADELCAAFMAFCASWQQGDRQGCAILAPLLIKYGIAPLPL